jgi:hypothetical protein
LKFQKLSRKRIDTAQFENSKKDSLCSGLVDKKGKEYITFDKDTGKQVFSLIIPIN